MQQGPQKSYFCPHAEAVPSINRWIAVVETEESPPHGQIFLPFLLCVSWKRCQSLFHVYHFTGNGFSFKKYVCEQHTHARCKAQLNTTVKARVSLRPPPSQGATAGMRLRYFLLMFLCHCPFMCVTEHVLVLHTALLPFSCIYC